MYVKAPIILGSLNADTKNGKLWVNAPNCVLRMSHITFQNELTKFSMIDVSNGKAVMLNGGLAYQVNPNFNYLIQAILTQVETSPEIETPLLEHLRDCAAKFALKSEAGVAI